MLPWLDCSYPPGPGGLCGGGETEFDVEAVLPRLDGRQSMIGYSSLQLRAMKITRESRTASQASYSSSRACNGAVIARSYERATADRLLTQSAKIAL
jgi:hypothetical protein